MKNRIKRVVTTTGQIYTTDKRAEYPGIGWFYNCTMTKTSYGSVIVEAEDQSDILEIYPSTIESIIYTK